VCQEVTIPLLRFVGRCGIFLTAEEGSVLKRSQMNKYVNRYDKNKEDKFVAAGFNVDFDLGFLEQLFINNNEKTG